MAAQDPAAMTFEAASAASARESFARAGLCLAQGDLVATIRHLEEANSAAEAGLGERAAAALALCRSLVDLERASRELESAHARLVEARLAEHEKLAAALRALLAGASSLLPPAAFAGTLPMALGAFALPFVLGVREVPRPRSLAHRPSLRLHLLGGFGVEVDGRARAPSTSPRRR